MGHCRTATLARFLYGGASRTERDNALRLLKPLEHRGYLTSKALSHVDTDAICWDLTDKALEALGTEQAQYLLSRPVAPAGAQAPLRSPQRDLARWLGPSRP
jgi:hypothetical protein